MTYKRLIAAVACMCMIAPMTVNSLASHVIIMEASERSGDANGDGAFNVADLVAMQQWLHGTGEISGWNCVDFTQDGAVDVFDFLLMKKALIEKYPDIDIPVTFTAENLCEIYSSEAVMGAEADEEFILGQTEFYLSLMQKTVQSEEAGKNVLVSPYSVMQALAMTANGADGNTKTQMEETLGGMSMERLNEYLYTQRMSQPNMDNCKLSTANSIWTIDDEERIQVKPEFIQKNMNYYSADIFKAPFDDTTVKDINSWVNENTDEMIPKLVEQINPGSVMYLINAVVFDAKWSVPYSEEQVNAADFTAYDGTVQQADMMYSTESYYLEDENAAGFYKYYQGRRYAFAALMPNEGISVEEYIAGLTPESLNQLLSNPKSMAVSAGIPKFSYDYGTNMNNTLSEMGMPAAFTPAADFSEMADTATGYLYISNVIHKTRIEVAEEGTRAAAATMVEMNDAACPMIEKEIILDRPFVYCIVDTETDLPVFMGTLSTIPE